MEARRRAEIYLRTIRIREDQEKLGVYVYHKQLFKLLNVDELNEDLRPIVAQYRNIVNSSDFAQCLARVGIGFAVLDVWLDWGTIIYYNSGWPMTIAITLLVIGYFFNIFYMVMMREMTLGFLRTFLKAESSPKTKLTQKLHTFIQYLVSCWQFILCKCVDTNRAPSSNIAADEQEVRCELAIADEDARSAESSEIHLNELEQNAISSAFVDVNSARIILLGIASVFFSPSIFMNWQCRLYMRKINKSLDKLEAESTTESSSTWLNLHCESFILFGLSYISKEAHNIELLTETLPQLILQLYMVFQYAFNSPLGFNQSLEIPWWRSIGFVLSFLAIGNAMRSSVVGKWEYYYYEFASESDIRENVISKYFKYSPFNHLINLLGHSCILSKPLKNLVTFWIWSLDFAMRMLDYWMEKFYDTAVTACLCFLYSPYLGFGMLAVILCLPTLEFLRKGPGDNEESWANRYMWFFTRVFSCLDEFSPAKRYDLKTFATQILVRTMFYFGVLLTLIYLKTDVTLLCLLTFFSLIVGYILLVIERLNLTSHYSLCKLLRLRIIANDLDMPS